jgi:hypothetical protein
MTQAKHTPGPWNIGMRSGANSNLIYAYNGAEQHDDDSICSVYGMYQHTEIENQKEGVGLANARLIAAAPELLDELKAVEAHLHAYVEAIEWGGGAASKSAERLASVRKAIAKAEGGAS